MAELVTSDIFFQRLFADLDEKEKIVVSEHLVMGKTLQEVADDLMISYRQVSRYKKAALLHNTHKPFHCFR